MTSIEVPVRYYKDYPGGYDYGYEDLKLPLESAVAFLLVDVDGSLFVQGRKNAASHNAAFHRAGP